MSAEIKVLPTYTREVQQDVIEVLESVLALTRRGEVSAVAIALVGKDKMSASTRFSMSDCLPAQIGAIQLLLHRILSRNERS